MGRHINYWLVYCHNVLSGVDFCSNLTTLDCFYGIFLEFSLVA